MTHQSTPSLANPQARAVTEDALLESGRSLSWLGWVLTRPADAAADADADDAAAADADAADADDDDADDADDAAAADDDADADDAADDADDAAADDAAADDAARRNINRILRGAEMREGLVLLQLPGRYWAVTRIGWARRVEGDEWELLGARTIVRTGQAEPLDKLASRGIGTTHRLNDASEAPELFHRLLVRRCLVANEKAWAKNCPRPADWGTR